MAGQVLSHGPGGGNSRAARLTINGGVDQMVSNAALISPRASDAKMCSNSAGSGPK